MSARLMGMVFDHYPESTPAEMLLAVKLADNAHDDGRHIFPAVSTLARQVRQSERTVQYTLRRMVDAGWLILVKEGWGGGRGGGCGRPREYRISATWIKAHDSRIPESERPQWTPKPQRPADEPDRQSSAAAESRRPATHSDRRSSATAELQRPAATEEMGANSAPISGGKQVQADAEMGATAVAEMGAIAVAPYPPLTIIGTTPLPPAGGSEPEEASPRTARTPGTAEQPPTSEEQALTGPAQESAFEAVWAAYPRKEGRKGARRVFFELKPGPSDVRAITAAITAWSRSSRWVEQKGRFVPALSAWLEGERWRDDPPPDVVVGEAQREAAPPTQAPPMTAADRQRNSTNAAVYLARARALFAGAV